MRMSLCTFGLIPNYWGQARQVVILNSKFLKLKITVFVFRGIHYVDTDDEWPSLMQMS
jgi:hypothetical protein